MAMTIIKIPKDPTAPRTVKVVGVFGTLCKHLTEGVERAMGQVISDEPTAEFFYANQQVDQEIIQEN